MSQEATWRTILVTFNRIVCECWIIAALVWGHDLFFSVSRGGGDHQCHGPQPMSQEATWRAMLVTLNRITCE